MSKYILHIETEPMPIAELLVSAPEFRAASNIKDPAKIAEDISRKKQKYIDEAQFNEASANVCAAALTDVVTGKQQIVSIYGGDFPEIKTEENVLSFLAGILKFGSETITFRGVKFAYPFLVRRAAVYGINLFKVFYDEYHPGKLVEELHTDLAKIWACGGLSHPESIHEVLNVLKLKTNLSNVSYHQLAKSSPAEADTYLLNVLDTIEELNRRLR